MKTDDIDKTIENIGEVLAENEPPLPKAAPTQHGIDQPPREIDPEAQMCRILECARLPGVDVMSGIHLLRHFVEPSARHCFQIRCKQCSFRFQSRSKVYNLDRLGELHSDRNNHEVALTFHYGSLETGITIHPVKRTHWLQKYCFLWIPIVIAIIFASFVGWHSLPLYLLTSSLGGWGGELIYRKWLKPKQESQTQ